MSQYTTEQLALYHTMIASRKFIEMGQYDTAATIMMAGADGYDDQRLSSAQKKVSK